MAGKKSWHVSTMINQAITYNQRSQHGERTEPSKKSGRSRKKNCRAKKTASNQLVGRNGDFKGHIQPYGMTLSKERLCREGFSAEVCTLTPQQMIELWKLTAKRHLSKPSKEDFIQVIESRRPNAGCMGFLLSPYNLYQEYRKESSGFIKQYEFQFKGGVLASLFAMDDLAGSLIEELFNQGYESIRQLCMSSKAIWQAVSSNTSTWNALTGDFENRARSSVFVVFTPEHIIGHLTTAFKTQYQSFVLDGDTGKQWYLEVREAERDIADEVYRLRKATLADMVEDEYGRKDFGHYNEPLLTDSHDESVMLASLGTVAKINQFASKEWWERYQLPLSFAAGRLNRLLTQVSIQRDIITVLHLHTTALVDRRVAAVLLRACSNTTMLGIYNCPLLHFGDLTALLDLIYEVNQERERTAKAIIQSFDFFPRYYAGRPFKVGNAAAYGLTSNPLKLEIVQRGFYTILLKAFLKAREMKLRLLFEPEQALQKFLFEVPNPPLQVVSFLDAVLRLTRVEGNILESNDGLKALYDVLKPVRLGLDSGMDEDWAHWYQSLSCRELWFCSSCGYSFQQEFFPDDQHEAIRHRRVCAGCSFQSWLDNEHHDAHQEARAALGRLFPSWDRFGFNLDAPIPRGIRQLVFLQSRKSTRPDIPMAVLNAEGIPAANPAPPMLVRDNKINFDSMQGLPSLSDLVSEGYDKQWSELVQDCRKVDLYGRIVRSWKAEMDESGRYVSPKEMIQLNLHHFEHFPFHRDESSCPQSFNFYAAAIFYHALEKKNW